MLSFGRQRLCPSSDTDTTRNQYERSLKSFQSKTSILVTAPVLDTNCSPCWCTSKSAHLLELGCDSGNTRTACHCCRAHKCRCAASVDHRPYPCTAARCAPPPHRGGGGLVFSGGGFGGGSRGVCGGVCGG